jgi:drug/metabolite transporter (DMT)-like permease
MGTNSRQDRLVRAMPAVFVLIWSTGFIVARYGMPHAPPMKFLAMRYALSVACFFAWAAAARAAWPRGGLQWTHLAVTGVLMHAGYLGGVWAAVKSGMGAGLAALLVGLQPVLTAIWVSSRGGEVSGRQWGGLALGLAGLLLVVWQKLGFGEVHALNLLFALAALVAITAGTLYQKRFVAPCDVRTANLVQLAAAFIVTAPLAALEAEGMRWTGPGGALNLELAGAMAWSVLGLTLGGSSLLYLLIQRGAATTVTSLMYLVPPTTALMAWALFGEPITPLIVTGMALTAVGVSLVVRPPKAR